MFRKVLHNGHCKGPIGGSLQPSTMESSAIKVHINESTGPFMERDDIYESIMHPSARPELSLLFIIIKINK